MVRAGRNGGRLAAFFKHDLFPELVSETHALIAADINGDGLKDLVTGKRFWSHGKNEAGSDKPARLYWFEAAKGADGMITFTPREIDDQSGIGTQFVVADFNGDSCSTSSRPTRRACSFSSRPARRSRKPTPLPNNPSPDRIHWGPKAGSQETPGLSPAGTCLVLLVRGEPRWVPCSCSPFC